MKAMFFVTLFFGLAASQGCDPACEGNLVCDASSMCACAPPFESNLGKCECPPTKSGAQCQCDVVLGPDDTVPPPVLSVDEIVIAGGVLTIVYSESIRNILNPEGPAMVAYDDENNDSDPAKCQSRFNWTFTETNCSYRKWVGHANFADVFNGPDGCNFLVDEKPDIMEITFRFGLKSKRPIRIGDTTVEDTSPDTEYTWTTKITEYILPMTFELPKTVSVSTDPVTVTYAAVKSVLKMEFLVAGDKRMDDVQSIAQSIYPGLTVDVKFNFVDNVGNGGMGDQTKIIIFVTPAQGQNVNELACPAPGGPLSAEYGDPKFCAPTTEAIAARGVVEQVVGSVSQYLTPIANIVLFTSVMHPFKLINPKVKDDDNRMSYGHWQLDVERNMEQEYECTLDPTGVRECQNLFNWTIRDDNSPQTCDFSGMYHVEFDVVCIDGYENASQCPLLLDGSEIVTVDIPVRSAFHCAQLAYEVETFATLETFKEDPGKSLGAIPFNAFINNQRIWARAGVRADVALTEARFAMIKLVKPSGNSTLFDKAGPVPLSADGTALGLKISEDIRKLDPAALDDVLMPAFDFQADADVLGIARKATGAFEIHADIDLKYEVGGPVRRRVRMLLQDEDSASTAVDATFNLDGGDETTDDGNSSAGFMTAWSIATPLAIALSVFFQ